MNRNSLQILIVDDSEDDAFLICSEVQNIDLIEKCEHAIDKLSFERLLTQQKWDVILTDHNMPGFSSWDVLRLSNQSLPDIPVIIVSGTIGEESAVESMKAGFQDYVLKDNLSRLVPSINNAIQNYNSLIEKQQIEDKLHKSREQYRELVGHMETVREQERLRIAQDIHDDLGGTLAALKFDTSLMRSKLTVKDDDFDKRLERMSYDLDNAVKSVRRIISDLRPSVLDDLGLIAAIEWLSDTFSKRHNIHTFVSYDEKLDGIIENNIAVPLFRITQETFNNILKHAKASEVRINIAIDNNHILLSIKDNGIGFNDKKDIPSGHYGILGMRDRVERLHGSFKISSQKNSGTDVSVTIPLTHNQQYEQ
ncbi:MAG: histidine kinase [Gammaproteobacteria bacterium]|nr:histidine kinase [Gammaproteobacteria bacterium]